MPVPDKSEQEPHRRCLQGECLVEVARLLHRHAEHIDPVAFERARNQLTVRALRTLEQPARRLEAAALDVFTFGRPRDTAESLSRLLAVTTAQVREAFERILASPAALALAGSVPARVRERAVTLFGLGPQDNVRVRRRSRPALAGRRRL